METTTWPMNEKIKAIFIPKSSIQFEEIQKAKELDAMCNSNHKQFDRSHHLVCLQKQHLREGKVTLEIFNSIYGFQVRNTDNYGEQRMLWREASAKEALEFCKKWYESDSNNRGVIVGYIFPEKLNEFEIALNELE